MRLAPIGQGQRCDARDREDARADDEPGAEAGGQRRGTVCGAVYLVADG